MKNGSLGRSLLLSAAVIGCQGCGDSNQQVKSAPGGLPSGQLTRADRTHEIHATTFFAHGHLLERQGAFERAVEQYQAALKAKADFLICLNRLGITLNKLGRHAEATEHFRKAIVLRSDLAHLHNNLGFSLYLEAKFEEAERSLARALELKSDFGRARMNHAITLAKLGKYNEAFAEMRTTTGAADAAFNMGMLLSEAGRFADAAKYLEAALAAKPSFEAARAQLNELSKLAAAEDAETNAAKAIDSLRIDSGELTTTEAASVETVSAATTEVSEPALTTADPPPSANATTATTSAGNAHPATIVHISDDPTTTADVAVEDAWTTTEETETTAMTPTPDAMTQTTISTADTTAASAVSATNNAAIAIDTAEPITTSNDSWMPATFDDIHAASWFGTELTGDVGVVAGTTVEAPATGWSDGEFEARDPNCATATSETSPFESITIPAIRPEVVANLIDDFSFTVKWHRELAAEVLCRLETYMQTGQIWNADEHLAE